MFLVLAIQKLGASLLRFGVTVTVRGLVIWHVLTRFLVILCRFKGCWRNAVEAYSTTAENPLKPPA
ncbi:MAG: hypothetical protein B7Z75_12240 [Acidocella sp. 20-57-95]|nr:MAG: hypothetical protein B7Z75_12240 [Acidocella sp. 20-57-95]OYV62168.1 MAG: hypothetical protein B7Z71_02335 [Acidocella sp. 21-58-7]